MKIEYLICHHNDADGLMSAINMYYYLKNNKNIDSDKIKFEAVNYNSNYSYLKKYKKINKVYILDFFDKKLISKLENKTDSIEVYDHHLSTLEIMNKYRHPKVTIYCTDRTIGACEFIYNILKINHDNLYKFTKAISTWDVWNKSDINYFFNSCWPLKIYFETINNPVSLYTLITSLSYEEILNQAKLMSTVETTRIYKVSKNYFISYLYVNKQKYKVACLNSDIRSSLVYELATRDGIINDLSPDIIMHFNHIKPDKIAVSIYSKSGVNVLKIAKHFGGGGHVAAAGFEAKNIIFSNNIITIETR